MCTKNSVVALLIASFAGISSAAVTGQDAGIVMAAGPDTTVRGLPVKPKDAVLVRSNVMTSASRAQIQFIDGGVMFISPETDVTVLDYSFDARAPDRAHAEIPMSEGEIRFITGAIPKSAPKQLVIKTNYGDFTPISGDFTVTVCGPDCATRLGAIPGAYLKVTSGSVIAKSALGNSIIVSAGQFASMTADEVHLIERLPEHLLRRVEATALTTTSLSSPIVAPVLQRVEPQQFPVSGPKPPASPSQ